MANSHEEYFNALICSQTLTLVPLNSKKQDICCKWTFRNKNPDVEKDKIEADKIEARDVETVSWTNSRVYSVALM